MVGDRFHDQEVALKAGIPFVGCAFGFAREDELNQVDAWALKPVDLPKAIALVIKPY